MYNTRAECQSKGIYIMKICSKCNKELPFDQFYRDNRSASLKYRSMCVGCIKSQYAASYRTANIKKWICKHCKSTFSVNSNYAPNPSFCSRQCHAAFKSSLDYSESFWTSSMQSYIDGLMLSDIGIRKDNSFQWNVKYEEFAEFIANCLLPYDPSVKNYIRMYTGRTKTHPDIKNQRQRWYPNGTKIVPKDVIIDPICLAMLYIGDGHIHKVKGNITISTLSFSEKENNFLSEKMFKNLGVKSRVISMKDRYCLYFSRPNAVEFLKIIGNKSPVKCYDYKFVVPSKQAYRNYQRELRKRNHEKSQESFIEAL